MKTEKNPAITLAKVLAIFSVVCAHCNGIGGNGALFVQISSHILRNIGTFGVGCFFILSGALFNPTNYTFPAFAKKKLVTLGVPWIISASVVYLYVALRKPPVSFSGWFKYVLGYNTYCYYLAVLFLLYILYYLPFMRTDAGGCICAGVSFLSVLFFYDKGFLTPYLDVTNWMGYFAIGTIIRRHREHFEIQMKRILAVRIIPYAICSGLVVYQVCSGRSGYMGGINAITTFSGVFALMLCSTALAQNKLPVLFEMIGNNSLFIYLWHMPLAGIATNLGSRGVVVYTVLLRPFVIMSVMTVVLLVVRKSGKRICRLLGVR